MSEEEIEVTVDTNTEGDTQHQDDSNEETVDFQAELEREREARRQVTARAKRAEEELKQFKSQPQNINNNTASISADELKLIARGLSDDEIEKAKIIAKGTGVSLTEALNDDMFTSYQSNLKEKQRKENAKLGASRGSGETQPEVKGTESGASREDHMEAWKKKTGN